MGREIRRVPADWDHPSNQALYDRDFNTFAADWMASAILWAQGKHKDQRRYAEEDLPAFYWQWAGMPPDPDYYRPAWTDEERTHYQVYETVSEGTPVSPAFATQDELIDYLVENGDYWCQRRPDEDPPSREAATAFVKGTGWVPTGVGTAASTKWGISAAEDLKI